MSLIVRSRRQQWVVFCLAAVLLTLVAAGLAGQWARQRAEAGAGEQARSAAVLHAAVLRSELERQRSLPLVLAQDPDAVALLSQPTARRVDQMNRKLESLADDARAAVIYVLDTDGLTRAASNWDRPDSFVGSNYGFRPYFIEALGQGQADFFALGTVSGRPGLYLARRIDDPAGRPLGVVVAKVEFAALEAEWRGSGEPTFVIDRDGVVLITTVPEWRFHTTRPLTEERRRRLAIDQTAGSAVLEAMPFVARPGEILHQSEAGPGGPFAVAQDDTPGLGWTVILLSPAGQIIRQSVAAARWLAGLSVVLLFGVLGVLLRRRQRAQERELEAEAARLDLEARIEQRTSELRQANVRLNAEIEERRRLEESRQALQDDLIQATKLATLGQIAAGVAHEINQPLAAIRTHSETAGLQLQRQNPSAAETALTRIVALTDRVGRITDELRAFSRKTRSAPSPVNVEEAIEGALLLAGPRLKEGGVTLTRSNQQPNLEVMAEHNRLEQVILNLVQNSLEAMRETPQPTLDIRVDAPEPDGAQGQKVRITVRDNGPGISDDVRQRLFTPFTTDKATGLGLGLVISRDIVASFGGQLDLQPSAAGAVFTLELRVAP